MFINVVIQDERMIYEMPYLSNFDASGNDQPY